MSDEHFRNYITQLMQEEIAVAITDEQISYKEAIAYTKEVIDRFSNPFLEHRWLSICLQYSSKMLMRNIPILLKHYAKGNAVPSLMATGFAAYILFMKSEQNEKGEFIGSVNPTGNFLIFSTGIDTLFSHIVKNESLSITSNNPFIGICVAHDASDDVLCLDRHRDQESLFHP